MSKVIAWYISRAGQASGPFVTDMLLAMIRDGQIKPIDLVFQEGDEEWKPAASFSELRPAKRPGDSQWDEAGALYPNTRDRIQPAPLVTWILLRPHGSTYIQEGPYSTQAVLDGLRLGRFLYSQYAWRAGNPKWVRVGELAEFDRRAETRDTLPPLPPPLPDPIEAILLEDDDDSVSEEIQAPAMPPVQVQALQGPEIGGAAAESPEEKASVAMQLVVSTPDLAEVPWMTQGTPTATPPGTEHTPTPALEVELGTNTRFVQIDDDPQTASKPFVSPPKLPAEAPPTVPPIPVPPLRMVGIAAASAILVLIIAFSGFRILIQSNIVPLSDSPHDKPMQLAEMGSAKPAAAPAAPAPALPAADPLAPMPVFNEQAPLDIKIVGVRLDRPDGQIQLHGGQNVLPTGRPIQVVFKGRLGQVLRNLSVRRTATVERRGIETPSLSLKSLALPEGSYTVEVSVDDRVARSEIFVGKRDRRFLDRLEAHLREIAFESQSQKKALFYSAGELDELARELGQKYGELRSNGAAWSGFYSAWQERVRGVHQKVSQIKGKKLEEQAYPEESTALSNALSGLMDIAAQFDLGIGQKRDIASDALSELIAELGRQKTEIGAATARPDAL